MFVTLDSKGSAISFHCDDFFFFLNVKVIEHKPYDHKVDVFSFGIALWELLTGEVSSCFDLSIHFMDVFMASPV